MKLSEMFEPKKDRPKKGKTNKMSYEVFMGLMFLVCCFIQGVLFEIIERAYNLPETNTLLDTFALLLMFSCSAAALLCFADHLYKRNKRIAIILLVSAIILLFFAVLFTIIDLIEVCHG